jgi:hypothetical protein
MRPLTRTQELLLVASGFGLGGVLQGLVVLYICRSLQAGLSDLVAALVGRYGRTRGFTRERLMHLLPLRRRLGLQPLDRVEDPAPRLGAGHAAHSIESVDVVAQ